MEHLATLGSHSVTSVSEAHSGLIKDVLLPNFYEIYPERFLNVTTGVSQRRWLLLSNPRLADLITNTIGDR